MHALGFTVWDGAIPSDGQCATAMLDGRVPAEVDANGRAARQIASLWRVIEQQLALDCDASSAQQPARRKA
jgi:hypothetical protein